MPFDPADPSPIRNLPNSSWPTTKQLAAIGSVMATWNWLDLAIEEILAELAKSDDMLIQAFTADLSPDNRLKALKRLVTTWERTYGGSTPDQIALLAELRDICQWIAKHKAKRNQIAHRLWIRSDDENLFGWKHKTAPAHVDEDRSETILTSEISEFAIEIGKMVARVNEARDTARKFLPAWPRSSLDSLPVPGLASLIGPYRIPKEP